MQSISARNDEGEVGGSKRLGKILSLHIGTDLNI